MTREEKIQLRMNILGGMNEHVLGTTGNEEAWEVWFSLGIPDGADEDNLKDIAEDEDLWQSVCKTFAFVNTFE